ncbi:MAG: hypothetical protein ACREF5_02995 [Candidatus Saccharimonadales bacterium]
MINSTEVIRSDHSGAALDVRDIPSSVQPEKYWPSPPDREYLDIITLYSSHLKSNELRRFELRSEPQQLTDLVEFYTTAQLPDTMSSNALSLCHAYSRLGDINNFLNTDTESQGRWHLPTPPSPDRFRSELTKHRILAGVKVLLSSYAITGTAPNLSFLDDETALEPSVQLIEGKIGGFILAKYSTTSVGSDLVMKRPAEVFAAT